jgi:hypothetical protein
LEGFVALLVFLVVSFEDEREVDGLLTRYVAEALVLVTTLVLVLLLPIEDVETEEACETTILEEEELEDEKGLVDLEVVDWEVLVLVAGDDEERIVVRVELEDDGLLCEATLEAEVTRVGEAVDVAAA